jgi:hypothetical protein
MHSWITFDARLSLGHTQTQKIHHNPNSRKATTFPVTIFSMISHGGYTQILKIETPDTLEAHKFLCKHPIEVRF